MNRLRFTSRRSRLVAVVIGALFGAAWYPTGLFLTGEATSHGMIRLTDCFMEPEFYHEGVSARQICAASQLSVDGIFANTLISLGTLCLTLAPFILLAWILDGLPRQRPIAPVPPPVPPEPRSFPSYINSPPHTGTG